MAITLDPMYGPLFIEWVEITHGKSYFGEFRNIVDDAVRNTQGTPAALSLTADHLRECLISDLLTVSPYNTIMEFLGTQNKLAAPSVWVLPARGQKRPHERYMMVFDLLPPLCSHDFYRIHCVPQALPIM